jgi:hypothetical protein
MVSTSAAGYIAGTYISSAQISFLTASALGLVTAGAATISGLLSAAVGSAGIFGTTIGATGLTGMLMSAGLLPAVPVAAPIAALSGLATFLYVAFALFKLKRKIALCENREEAVFSDLEAKLIQALIVLLHNRGKLKDPEGDR